MRKINYSSKVLFQTQACVGKDESTWQGTFQKSDNTQSQYVWGSELHLRTQDIINEIQGAP